MESKRQLRVDLLAGPETSGSILYGLYDTLMMPGTAWERAVHGRKGTPLADVRIVARSRDRFTCGGGIPVVPAAALEDAVGADLVCVPNMLIPAHASPIGWLPNEVSWLRERYEGGAIIAAVCSGAILLAEAGLLHGFEATSHWAYAHMFKRYYPDIAFRPERTLTFSGPGDRLVIAGGMASWQNLSLYLIARFFGVEQASHTAKVYCMPEHVRGQLPFATLSRRVQGDDSAIGVCQVWIAENYAEQEPVSIMRRMSGLPERTFNRRFELATGYRPTEYVQAIRVEEAKQLLESSTESLESIAAAVGYRDVRAFRRLFAKRTSMTPSEYRKRFNRDRFLTKR